MKILKNSYTLPTSLWHWYQVSQLSKELLILKFFLTIDDSEFIIGNYDQEYADENTIEAKNVTNNLILDPGLDPGEGKTIILFKLHFKFG